MKWIKDKLRELVLENEGSREDIFDDVYREFFGGLSLFKSIEVSEDNNQVVINNGEHMQMKGDNFGIALTQMLNLYWMADRADVSGKGLNNMELPKGLSLDDIPANFDFSAYSVALDKLLIEHGKHRVNAMIESVNQIVYGGNTPLWCLNDMETLERHLNYWKDGAVYKSLGEYTDLKYIYLPMEEDKLNTLSSEDKSLYDQCVEETTNTLSPYKIDTPTKEYSDNSDNLSTVVLLMKEHGTHRVTAMVNHLNQSWFNGENDKWHLTHSDKLYLHLSYWKDGKEYGNLGAYDSPKWLTSDEKMNEILDTVNRRSLGIDVDVNNIVASVNTDPSVSLRIYELSPEMEQAVRNIVKQELDVFRLDLKL